MRLLDLTLPTPAENLALDEALLETAELSDEPRELLRLWESPVSAVIVGRSSQVAMESRRENCERLGVPVLRRCSGGAAVMIGPGCLMYAVVLSHSRHPELQLIERAHRFVMETMTAGLRTIDSAVEFQGTSDLVLRGKKFSGNSLRCKRTHLLYHGTLLYNFPLTQIGECLGTPPRQPDYRAGRSHLDFVTNLPTDAASLRSALRTAWSANEPLDDWPVEMTSQLVAERYGREEWNRRL